MKICFTNTQLLTAKQHFISSGENLLVFSGVLVGRESGGTSGRSNLPSSSTNFANSFSTSSMSSSVSLPVSKLDISYKKRIE